MLRDPSLVPLSHQHHSGLALSVLTRRSLAADDSVSNIGELAQRIRVHYELQLANHFAIEEEVLFPACGGMPLIAELIADHRALERLIADLAVQPSAGLIECFCELLSNHIRREEKDLFEEIQRLLPRELLDRTGAEIDRRAVRVCL